MSRIFGLDRGTPVDRYYIENFLATQSREIRGRVLEVGDARYTRKFGGPNVEESTVLSVTQGEGVMFTSDLTDGREITSEIFDCVILTQTLQFIYDTRAAIGTIHRILRPEGVVLATLPGISQISRYDMERWGEYWRFTSMSARRLFEEFFPPANVNVQVYGNVLSSAAFLYGLVAEELRKEELDFRDPDYELLIAVRAVKPDDRGPAKED